jgi:predicted MPP superfamily phosphohydrolase
MRPWSQPREDGVVPDHLHPAVRALGVVAGAGLAAGAGALTWAAAHEVHAFRLRRVEVPVLPAGARRLRVLHLTDLHLTPSDARRVAWVRSLAALEPDLVVDTGDNLAHLDAVPTVLDALEPLLHLPGAFVLGSNDYYAPTAKNPLRYFGGPSRVRVTSASLPTSSLVDALTGAGWADLTNRRDVLEVRGRRVELVGMDDPHLRRDRMPGPEAGEPDALRLGVVHAPYRRALDALAADGAGLVLAGHTHGGQVCVPFVGALVTNCDLPTRYAKGLHRWTGADGGEPWLHVSAGVGTSPFARIRFACPPEATLLTLVARR